MIINHNMNALNAHRNMTSNTSSAGKSMEKLSSGLRINRAGDDAAGLAISEKMRGQIRGLDQASRNAQDGISMIQTAEGALNETHSIIQRMRELAVQAGNDTNTQADREEIQKEINQLTSEVNRIGNTTEFNTQKLLNGNRAGLAGATITETTKATATIGDLTIEAKNGGEAGNGLKIEISASTTTSTLAATIKDGVLKIQLGKDGSTSSEIKAEIEKITSVSISATAGTSGTKMTEKVSTELAGGADAVLSQGSAKLQIGANKNQSMTVDIADMRASALGISGSNGNGFAETDGVTDGTSDTATEAALDVLNHENASKAVKAFDNALNLVSGERSKLGAMQNRLEHTINNLGTSSENLTAAESRVRDVDMAKEMMTFSKNNILQQAAQAMLAQANQQPQGVLQLLR